MTTNVICGLYYPEKVMTEQEESKIPRQRYRQRLEEKADELEEKGFEPLSISMDNQIVPEKSRYMCILMHKKT